MFIYPTNSYWPTLWPACAKLPGVQRYIRLILLYLNSWISPMMGASVTPEITYFFSDYLLTVPLSYVEMKVVYLPSSCPCFLAWPTHIMNIKSILYYKIFKEAQHPHPTYVRYSKMICLINKCKKLLLGFNLISSSLFIKFNHCFITKCPQLDQSY